jgi:hypothetical protein
MELHGQATLTINQTVKLFLDKDLVGWVHSERTRRLVAFALLIIFGGVVLISVSTYLEKRYTGVLRVVIHSRPVEK